MISKKILIYLIPSILMAIAGLTGINYNTPVFEEIVWPEKPVVETLIKELKEVEVNEAPQEVYRPDPIEEKVYEAEGLWKDGVYYGSAYGYGGTITAKVKIKNNKIKAINITEHSGETPEYYDSAKAVIGKILKKQSPDVDTVSGATYSSIGIKNAVIDALNKAVTDEKDVIEKQEDKSEVPYSDPDKDKEEKAAEGEATEVILDGLPADGIYTGTAECERFAYQVCIKVKFRKGSIKKILECKMVDNKSEKNVPYFDAAYKGMKSQIMDGCEDFDIVTGATYSCNAIISAYKDAYNQAVIAGGGTPEEETKEDDNQEDQTNGNGDNYDDDNCHDSFDDTDNTGTGEDTEDINDNQPDDSNDAVINDGEYRKKVWCDFGYNLELIVQIRNNRVSAILYEIDSSDDEDWDYCDIAWNWLKGKTSTEACLPDDIDVRTGATYSTKAMVQAYRDIYQDALAK